MPCLNSTMWCDVFHKFVAKPKVLQHEFNPKQQQRVIVCILISDCK